jgi:hypothetical protein
VRSGAENEGLARYLEAAEASQERGGLQRERRRRRGIRPQCKILLRRRRQADQPPNRRGGGRGIWDREGEADLNPQEGKSSGKSRPSTILLHYHRSAFPAHPIFGHVRPIVQEHEALISVVLIYVIPASSIGECVSVGSIRSLLL